MSKTDMEEGFARLAVDQWKLIRVLSRLVERLPIESQARVKAQVRFSTERLEATASQLGFRLEVFDGRKFEPSLPVAAANAQDFPGIPSLLVADTLEPTVVSDGRIVHLGKVNLIPETL